LKLSKAELKGSKDIPDSSHWIDFFLLYKYFSGGLFSFCKKELTTDLLETF
jgi:hypothetical protein